MNVRTDPKPTKRYKAGRAEWELLRAAKSGWCRVCETQEFFSPHAVEYHHLVGRDLGGDDFPDNLVPLCPDHHKMVEERSPVACRLLRSKLSMDETAYIVAKKGERFLERYYPEVVA